MPDSSQPVSFEFNVELRTAQRTFNCSLPMAKISFILPIAKAYLTAQKVADLLCIALKVVIGDEHPATPELSYASHVEELAGAAEEQGVSSKRSLDQDSNKTCFADCHWHSNRNSRFTWGETVWCFFRDPRGWSLPSQPSWSWRSWRRRQYVHGKRATAGYSGVVGIERVLSQDITRYSDWGKPARIGYRRQHARLRRGVPLHCSLLADFPWAGVPNLSRRCCRGTALDHDTVSRNTEAVTSVSRHGARHWREAGHPVRDVQSHDSRSSVRVRDVHIWRLRWTNQPWEDNSHQTAGWNYSRTAYVCLCDGCSVFGMNVCPC